MRLHPAAWSLFLLLALGIVAAGFQYAQPRSGTVPAYASPTTENATFDLGAVRGRVVVLDFFQISCASCLILERELVDRAPGWDPERVQVVSVGLAPDNDRATLRDYQEKHGLNWTVVSDQDGALEKFGIYAFPTLLVVGTDGTVTFRRAGPVSGDELDRVVLQSLAADAPRTDFRVYSLAALAVVAGVAAFFSPCAIGLLPGYVAHAVRNAPPGSSVLGRAAVQGIVASLGLLVVFAGVGGLAYAFGRTVTPWLLWLAPFAGLVFVVVGVLLLVRPYSVYLQRFFGPLTSITADPTARGNVGYFLYGIGYGAGAAGCTAPVLINLVALSSVAGARTGLTLVALYALSAATLMAVLTMVIAGGREGFAAALRRHAHKVEVASAFVFVLVGLFLLLYALRAGTLPA